MKFKLMYQELKVFVEEFVNELFMNEIEVWKVVEKKVCWVLLVFILVVVGFGVLMIQLFLWEYGDLYFFGFNQCLVFCYDFCEVVLVESIFEGLDFFNVFMGNFFISQVWLGLFVGVYSSLDIVFFYWIFINNDIYMQEFFVQQGEEVFWQLQILVLKGVNVCIVVSKFNGFQLQMDLQVLLQSGVQVCMVDMQKLIYGVLYIKFWVVDQIYFYLGSVNMDWCLLIQVKELGVVMYNCSCLV